MRSGRFAVVSSALLFLFGTAVPCHTHALGEEPSVREGPLIGEFYPCALCGDEYFRLLNTLENELRLEDYSVTDGEGTLTFSGAAVVAAKGSYAVSFNGSSFEAVFGSPPDLAIDSPAGDAANLSGSFRLADDGDSLALVSPDGLVVDFVVYGDCPETDPGWSGPPLPGLRKGEVVKRVLREGAPVDENVSSDWTAFREFRYGYTAHGPASCTVPEGGLVAFCSPDCSQDALLDEISGARAEILACAYELSSAPVTSALLAAVGRGVSVRLLLEGAPAGGMADDQVACLSVLAARGADVRVLWSDLDRGVVKHVLALHAKYLVVDRTRVVAMSENLVPEGVPSDRLFGNRGWGVAFSNGTLAGFLARLFEEDSRVSRPDVRSWTEDERFDECAVLPEEVPADHLQGLEGIMRSTGPAGVTLFVSPDCSPERPFLSSLLSSVHSVRAEQFQADLFWQDRWTGEDRLSPVIESVLDAMRGGGTAEILLDSSWFNLERHNETVAFMDSEIAAEDLSGDCALIDPRSPIGVLHNKGLVIDGYRTVVSSNNWVSASFARNRELAVVVDSSEVGEYFSRVFRMDWCPDTQPPLADAGPDVSSTMGSEVVLGSDRCSDDRVIADVSWDVGCDGTVDQRGPVFAFTGEREGSWVVMLVVTDAWGNEANDTVVLDFFSSGGEGPPGGSLLETAAERPAWAVPVMACIALLVARELARRRALRRPRKINHPGPGFHR